MSKLIDMKGVAVQGLYLSSWINSYALALSIHKHLEAAGLLGRVYIFLYVDNIQVFCQSELQVRASGIVESASSFIGCTLKSDAGFCSWRNPLDSLDNVCTRDETANQKKA
jgi:hypothetical protein